MFNKVRPRVHGYSKRQLVVDKFLDKYPGILSISDDTMGLINGCVLSAIETIHELEGDVKTKSVHSPAHYLHKTESLGHYGQELCLDLLPPITVLASGCKTRNIKSIIQPGCDTELLVVEFEVKNLAHHSVEFKDTIEELSTEMVKVYRYAKNNTDISDHVGGAKGMGQGNIGFA